MKTEKDRKNLKARLAISHRRIYGYNASDDRLEELTKFSELIFNVVCGAISVRRWQKDTGQLRMFDI